MADAEHDVAELIAIDRPARGTPRALRLAELEVEAGGTTVVLRHAVGGRADGHRQAPLQPRQAPRAARSRPPTPRCDDAGRRRSRSGTPSSRR